MSRVESETSDLDLDLQGQIGLETLNFVRFLVNVTIFQLFAILASKLKCVSII